MRPLISEVKRKAEKNSFIVRVALRASTVGLVFQSLGAAFLAGSGETSPGQFGDSHLELLLEGAFGFGELFDLQLLAVKRAIIAGQGGGRAVLVGEQGVVLVANQNLLAVPDVDPVFRARFRFVLQDGDDTGAVGGVVLWQLCAGSFTKGGKYVRELDKVIDNWSCSLTTRSLHVKKGVLNKIEKTVPLEKITDLQMSQGWIMRRFDLRTIAVETAGQSGPGSLISLMGIKDTERFRRDVLDQRDRMGGDTASAPTASDDGRTDPVLIEIRDSLKETTQLLERLVEQGRG